MKAVEAVVRRRAADRCEYCLMPQVADRLRFHVEHIVARQHGGSNELDNLALSCRRCNLKKGPNLSGIDPVTGQMTPLFHPRKDTWSDHFRCEVLNGPPPCISVRGVTPRGRATVDVLGINEEIRQLLRFELWREAVYELK